MKKDFRVTDNPALIYALDHFDEVLPCFIIEPSWISAPETSAFHIQAIAQAVNELSQRFSAIGKQLLILNDEVVPAIEQLNAQFPISAIVAHEEIGTLRTFKRDIAVSQWSKANGINFHEVIQTGVFRRLKNRNERHELWSAFTFGEITRSPKVGELEQKLAAPLQASNQLKQISIEEFGFQAPSLLAQKVSESAALQTLDEFLHQRGIEYSGGISSPNTAFAAGSRLSAHLAWGTISGRYVYQQTLKRSRLLKEDDSPSSKKWRRSLNSFSSRLHWRDHFIQRLESEPNMEESAIHPSYNEMIYDNDEKKMDHFFNGQTGYPMIDACMRCLNETGFLNFRMRSMITSFATHSLHLDWKLVQWELAKRWLDYEPGIHLSQLQMQAGVVGINTLRVYSPTKQLQDQDPQLTFTKRWIPELKHATMDDIVNHDFIPIQDYHPQIVEWKVASKIGKDRLWAIRKTDEAKEIAKTVYLKHGSRRSNRRRRK